MTPNVLNDAIIEVDNFHGDIMALNKVERKWTFEEYLAYEEETSIKHEYLDGEIYAMTGGTKKHAVISTNCTTEIGIQLRDSDCYVTNSEMRVQINPTKFVYPDFVVVCGKDEFMDDREITLLNPTLVAEVISDSSEKYDKGLKSEFYRSLSSLQHYLIIDPNRAYAQLYTRQTDDGWLFREFNQREMTISLEAIGVSLPMSEIYRGFTFEGETQ